MNKLLILFVTIGFMSCNGGCNKSSSSDFNPRDKTISHEDFTPKAPKEIVGKNVDVSSVVTRDGIMFKRKACELLSAQVVGDALGKTPQEIVLRNATPRDADPSQTACFYKWNDENVVSAGIFLQLLRNPIGDDYPDYISQMIEAKRSRGESGMEEEPIFFKKFDGFGDDGSYSTEAGKYLWRIGEEIVFQIAFNTDHSPAEQFHIATILAKEATENYIK